MTLFQGSLLPKHIFFTAIASFSALCVPVFSEQGPTVGITTSTDDACSSTLPCVRNSAVEKTEKGQPDSTATDTILDATVYQPHYSTKQLDWIPRNLLNSDQLATITPGCSGMYIDPLKAPTTTLAEGIDSQALIIEADSSEVSGGTKATLTGNVIVSQGLRSISAELMSYDRDIDSAVLEGDVTIRQPGMLILGDEARISTIQQSGKFTEARFVMHDTHMRGSASAIEQDGPDRLVLRDGSMTSCEPNSKAWELVGKELAIDRAKGQGSGKHVRLNIAGVPIFYIPYISFPIGEQRQSGFLFPSISSSGRGLDISIPYYFNLAEHYDATLTPRVITDRGFMLESEFRHLSELFSTTVSGAYLSDDEGGSDEDVDRLIAEGVAQESELRPYLGSNRWIVQLEQIGGRRDGWYSAIDYTRISDEDYFRDLGTSSFSVANQTYLNQSIDAGVSLPHWDISIRAQDYQTLLLDIDSPYRKVPELRSNGIYQKNNISLLLNNQLTYFDHRQERFFNNTSVITGQRLATDYRLQWNYRSQAGFFKPEVGYKFLGYRLDVDNNDRLNNKEVHIGTGQLSLDAGLTFENPKGNYLQILEPRIFYLYRGYEDHAELYDATTSGQDINFDTSLRTFSYNQLYRDSRFSGHDRLDDANRMTIGITNRWQSHRDGHEFFNLSIGRINHLRDRRVGLERDTSETETNSELSLEFAANWRNGSGFFGSIVYDDGTDRANRLSAGYQFASKDHMSLFSIRYNFVRENSEVTASEALNQVDTSFVVPLTPQWSAMARANYDFENKQELESFLGFEYNDCCYRIRLVGRRWLDSNIANFTDNNDALFDQGIFFEIHFKGLGGSGAKVDAILEDGIPGYRRREQHLR